MKQVLADRHLKLSRSMGQNFLHDQNQVRRIVAAAELQPDDKVLEIGPGLGPLTGLLVQKCAEVLAIEKDRRLCDFLEKKFRECPNLKLLHGDALEYVRVNRLWAGWKLVANLPYSVASPILVELAQAQEPCARMVATLQLEVARRIVAAAGAEDYGLLGLLVRLRWQTLECFKISGSCFFPEPGVDSACIVLEPRPVPILREELHAAFTKIVKRAFSQRRKMMFKLLKADWPKATLARAFEQAGLPPQTRAENVSLDQFAKLTETLASL